MSAKTSRNAALVTGAAVRIGKGLALKLAELGFQVALHYNHSEKDVREVANLIKKEGGQCATFQCDLSDAEETKLLIGRVKERFSKLNLLINSASIFEKSSLTTDSLDSLKRHFAINFDAPYILTCSFAKECRTGQIINILDTNVVKNKTSYAAYLLSKKALLELTKLSAVQLGPDIRVNAIAPGLILPPTNQNNSYLLKRAQEIPLKRKGDIATITQCLQFLLENHYLTGQIIFNDGGEHLI